ncbi:MAG: hypothetical protein RMJ14_04490 [Nitrososphaerota archaeon]|nr:hypothetical protein [Nitrososphaerota archaeon]
MIFAGEPFTTQYITIENYIDGYGIGELSDHEFRRILEEIQHKINAELNLG